jgi:hypothetical protein
MLRGSKHLRTAQAVTLTVAAIMMVAIVAVALSAHDASDDWGVVWSEPASMSLDSIDLDESGEGIDLQFHLADAEGLATEWRGALSVQLTDENFDPVYEMIFHVRASAFTTVNHDGVVDTFYVMNIPFEHMSHVTERMMANPAMEISVRATFSFGQQTLTAERFWWPAPTYVKVESFYIDEENQWMLCDVYLMDETWRSAKWSGDLRIIIHDSNGAVMYNRSERISPSGFNMLSWGDTGWAWYTSWVPFEDIRLSSDRIEDKGENESGRWMRVMAEFRYEGAHLRQQPEGYTAVKNTHTIPDGLLKPNEPPIARLTADWYGMTGREHIFDASGTRDDLGTEGLRYEWSWGDGTLTDVTSDPLAIHTFARAGSFNVQLRVIDIEGASTAVDMDVEVLQDPRVDVEDIGEGELEGKIIDSYPLAKLRDTIASRQR